MNRVFLILAFTIGISSVYSQKFVPGYIITLENDTLHGEISNQHDLINLKECVFRNDLGKIKTYLPNDIYAYRFINGNYYISKEILENNNKKSVFLEYLVNGIVDLYYYPTTEGKSYYILKDNELVELTNTKRIKKINGNAYTTYDKKYIGILKHLFSDAPEVVKEVDNLKFRSTTLIKISENYHNQVCKDESCTVYKGADKEYKIGFKALCGYTFSSLNIKRYSSFGAEYGSKSSSSYSYSYGLAAFLQSPDRRFALEYVFRLNNSIYSNNKYSDNTQLTSNFDEIKTQKNENRIILSYTHPYYKLKPFVKTGVIFDKITDYEIIGGNEFAIASRYRGYTAGIGLKYFFDSNLGLELCAQYASLTGSAVFSDTKFNDISILFGVNYFIK
ncbi:hypothetical protein ACFLS4_03535 [Bacteroidota bacterium]